MAVDTQLHQTARAVAEATGQPGTDSTLMEFGACAVALRSLLYQDRPLAEAEFRFMDNHSSPGDGLPAVETEPRICGPLSERVPTCPLSFVLTVVSPCVVP